MSKRLKLCWEERKGTFLSLLRPLRRMIVYQYLNPLDVLMLRLAHQPSALLPSIDHYEGYNVMARRSVEAARAYREKDPICMAIRFRNEAILKWLWKEQYSSSPAMKDEAFASGRMDLVGGFTFFNRDTAISEAIASDNVKMFEHLYRSFHSLTTLSDASRVCVLFESKNIFLFASTTSDSKCRNFAVNVLTKAVTVGKFDFIRWLCEQRMQICPFVQTMLTGIAAQRDIKLLRMLAEEFQMLCDYKVYLENVEGVFPTFEVWEWAFSRGIMPTPVVVGEMLRFYNMEVRIQWLKDHGCPMDESTLMNAACSKYALKYFQSGLIDGIAPFHAGIFFAAAWNEFSTMELFEWLYDVAHCPWDVRVLIARINHPDYREFIPWAVERGCPKDWRVWEEANTKERKDFLLKLGFPTEP